MMVVGVRMARSKGGQTRRKCGGFGEQMCRAAM